MRRLLTILFLLPIIAFGQNLNVKVFSTHYGNGNTSQYGAYANSVSDMDKMTTTYPGTTQYWSGQMAASTCLNWGTWTTMYYAGAGIPNNGEYFSVEVSGVFTPVETGTYWFGVNSDDGSDILINGTLVTSYYGGHGIAAITPNIAVRSIPCPTSRITLPTALSIGTAPSITVSRRGIAIIAIVISIVI